MPSSAQLRLSVPRALTGGAPSGSPGVDELFARHAAELCRYAQRIVRTRDAAEDVVQEVFLRLWLRRDRVEIGGAIRAYLYASTRARAIDTVRRARRDGQRRRHGGVAEALGVVVPARGGHGGSVSEDCEGEGEGGGVAPLDLAAVAGAVARVLAALPPQQRRVATLRLRERRGTADIARELGISPRTVEAHVARARRALRAQLPMLLPTLLPALPGVGPMTPR